MSFKIVDRTDEYIARLNPTLENALREGARDIHISAKTKAPYKDGGLRSDSDFIKLGKFRWRIRFLKEYASVQEKGKRAGARRFTNYTTSGTGAHFLETSGDSIVKNLNAKFKKHIKGMLWM